MAEHVRALSANTTRSVCRIIAVHGKRQCGELFRKRLDTTLRRLRRIDAAVEVIWLDAPFTLPLEDGQDLPMRSWYERDEGGRSADLEPAMNVLAGAVSGGRVAGVLAFSQGCAVVAEAARRGILSGVSFFALAGGLLPPGWSDSGSLIPIPAIVFAGTKDAAVPTAMSEQLAAVFESSVFHLHEQGHAFPSRAADGDVLLSFIEQHWSSSPEAQHPADAAGATDAAADDTSTPFEQSEELADELVTLESMYPGDFMVEAGGRRCVVALSVEGAGAAELAFTFSPGYPESAAAAAAVRSFRLAGPGSHDDAGLREQLLLALRAAAAENLGLPSVFAAVQAAQEFLDAVGRAAALSTVGATAGATTTATAAAAASAQDGAPALLDDAGTGNGGDEGGSGCGDDDGSIDAEALRAVTLDAAVALLARRGPFRLGGLPGGSDAPIGAASSSSSFSSSSSLAHRQRGGSRMYWGGFTVGLVGKPSAGKSTFFNACKTLGTRSARVGAFPFTTIEPNLGRACFRAEYPPAIRMRPCAAAPEDSGPASAAGPAAGSSGRWHDVEVVLKDVAGLVPGAYQGRGKGNRFLDDLCGAGALAAGNFCSLRSCFSCAAWA